MAKVRVYELAKELQMENKVLVDLIRETGIEIKSHSSSLTDEEVSLIKGHLRGTKSLVVEEQRIKSTVIRRRKKVVEVEQAPESLIKEAISEERPESETLPEIPSVVEVHHPEVTTAAPEQQLESQSRSKKK